MASWLGQIEDLIGKDIRRAANVPLFLTVLCHIIYADFDTRESAAPEFLFVRISELGIEIYMALISQQHEAIEDSASTQDIK